MITRDTQIGVEMAVKSMMVRVIVGNMMTGISTLKLCVAPVEEEF